MDDDRYQKAVEAAREHKEEYAHLESVPVSELEARYYLEQGGIVLAAFVEMLIDEKVRRPQQAWDTLIFIAEALLRESKRLPIRLARWVADVLAGKKKRPRKDDSGTIARDLLIQDAVGRLVAEFDLKPTRNSGLKLNAGGGQSACDAVGEARGLGYKTVERIWNQRTDYDRKITNFVLSDERE